MKCKKSDEESGEDKKEKHLQTTQTFKSDKSK
jgi:hypothetical protein